MTIHDELAAIEEKAKQLRKDVERIETVWHFKQPTQPMDNWSSHLLHSMSQIFMAVYQQLNPKDKETFIKQFIERVRDC